MHLFYDWRAQLKTIYHWIFLHSTSAPNFVLSFAKPWSEAMYILCTGSRLHTPQHQCSLRGQNLAPYLPLGAPSRAKHEQECCWSIPHLMAWGLFLCLKVSLNFYHFCHTCGMERWELNTALQVRTYSCPCNCIVVSWSCSWWILTPW